MSLSTAQGHQKKPKKITKVRLKNIGLYYLERYESSVQKLRDVLRRRIDKYAFANPEIDKQSLYALADEVIAEFETLGYVSDSRFAALKVRDYLSAGKSARYIKTKLKLQGIDEAAVDSLIQQSDYDPFEAAKLFAKKKHIGPYRTSSDLKQQNFKKDMATLLRAGFDYNIVCDVLKIEPSSDIEF